MRAMRPVQRSAATGPLSLEEVAEPQPGPGQVRLRVRVCGVCHTDLHTVEGELELPRLPLTPGHQVVGIVDAIGPGVTRFALGDRAGVGRLYRACGACAACRAGQENLCANAEFTGLHADGGYGEMMVVDEAFAYPLPAAFDDVAVAPLLCAGIIGFRSLRLSGIQPGQRLGLYGFGASAHLAIQVAITGAARSTSSRAPSTTASWPAAGAAWPARRKRLCPADASVIFALWLDRALALVTCAWAGP